MERKNDKMKTTITLDKNIFKSLKKVAIDKEISQNQLMNDYIVEGLKNEEKGKSKFPKQIPEHLILNKDTYNPDPERHMKMAGIAKYGKPFSAVKLVREMREGGHDIL